MILRSLITLFDLLGRQQDPLVSYCVKVSFVEIYNEKVYDLLDDPLVSIFHKGTKYNGSTQKTIESAEDVTAILAQGHKNRHVRSTKLNKTSSRSHGVFSIFLESSGSDQFSVAKLNILDLAGSESIRKTEHEGIAKMEGVHINQGLLSISKVMQALSIGSKVIPFRDSALTMVLQGNI